MKKSVGFWVVVVVALATFAPLIIFRLSVWLYQRIGKPFTLQSPVSVVSPDGKKRFFAKADGLLTIVDAKTGLAIQKRRVSPEEYNRVEAAWLDKERLRVIGNNRFPALALNRSYLWNSKTGDWRME